MSTTVLLGLIYLGTYLGAGVYSVRNDLAQSLVPRWVLWIGGAGTLTASVGMFVYLAGLPTPTLRAFWPVVFAGLLFTTLLQAIHAYEGLVRHPDPELSGEESRSALNLALAFSLALEIPALYMNFRVAFG